MTSTPKPDLSSPAAIIELGTAFCTAKCLLTALELGLFTELAERPSNRDEIQQALGLHPRAMRDYLNILANLGLLARDGDKFCNSESADRWLVRTSPNYVGGFLERANHMLYPAWGRFHELLQDGKPTTKADYQEMIKDPEKLRHFLDMMDALNGMVAAELAKAFPWSEYTNVLDVGGARGNLVGNLVKLHPHLRGNVFDLPVMAEPFAKHMAQLDLTNKVTFHPGSFFDNPIPAVADVITIGHVLHDWSFEENQIIVDRAFAALPPGGALIVYDRMVDEHGTDLTNLVVSINMMMTTPSGAEYTPKECVSWLERAGCVELSQRPLGPTDTIVVGRKPAEPS